MKRAFNLIIVITAALLALPAFADYTITFTDSDGPVAGVSLEGNHGFGELPGRVSDSNGEFSFNQQILNSPKPVVFFKKSGFEFSPPALEINSKNCPASKCRIQVSASNNPHTAVVTHVIDGSGNDVEGVRIAVWGSELTETNTDAVGTAVNVIRPRANNCSDSDNDPYNNTVQILAFPPEGKTCTFMKVGADSFCPKAGIDNYTAIIASCRDALNSQFGTYKIKVISTVSAWGVPFRFNNNGAFQATNRSGEISIPVNESTNLSAVGYTFSKGTLYPPVINISNKSKDCFQNQCIVYLLPSGKSAAVEWSFLHDGQPIPGVQASLTDGVTKQVHTALSDQYGKVIFPATRVPSESPEFFSKISGKLEGYRFTDPTGDFHRYVNASYLTGSYLMHDGEEDSTLYTLEGKVFNSLGDPMEGIAVQVNEGDATSTTDSAGNWEIDVDAGTSVLVKAVEKDGYKFDPELIEIDPVVRSHSINFVAKLPDRNAITPPEKVCEIESDDGSYKVRGTVFDKDGKALANTKILNKDVHVATTNAKGEYEITVGPRSNNWITAELTEDSGVADIKALTPDPAGFTFHSYDNACNKNNSNFRFIDLPSLVIAGRVKYKDTEAPIPGITVSRKLGDGSPVLTTTTDGNGYYLFSVPIETSYEIGLANLDTCWQVNKNYSANEIIDSIINADFEVACPGSPTPTPTATPTPTPTPDYCPADPNKLEPGKCGCGVSDTDSDGDGTPNCFDSCPNDRSKTVPGVCGCGSPDTDADGDGVYQCYDICDKDSNKLSPGLCGCGIFEDSRDSDTDGTLNCHDECPSDENKTVPGTCGCGVSDADNNGDGTPDCEDVFEVCHIPSEYPINFKTLKVSKEKLAEHLAHGDIEGNCSQLPNKHNACAGALTADSYNVGSGENGSSTPGMDKQEIARALGSPEMDDSLNYLTLGKGGTVNLGFGGAAIYDAKGIDFYLAETSVGKRGLPCDEHPELVEVFGTEDGSSWVSMGTACRDAGFDIGASGLRWVKEIKLIDKTSVSYSDGYDIDGISCDDTTQCLDSDGDEVCDFDDGCPFDGKKAEPGVCGCGQEDKDTDGDGIPDCEEPDVGVIDLCLLDEIEDPDEDPDKKITLCHRTRSKTNPWVEIRISRNAVAAHMSHGDYLGSCSLDNPNNPENPGDGDGDGDGDDDHDHEKEQQKVAICHKTSSNKNPWVQIRVNYHAVEAHLAHGDYLGLCSGEDDPDKDRGASLTSYEININGTLSELVPWRVYNLGDSDQQFTWKIKGTEQTGEFDLPSHSFIEFDTERIEGENIIEIYLSQFPDIVADEQIHKGCEPLNPLSITPSCSDDPAVTNWLINNPNDRDVEVDWSVLNTEQKALVIAKGGIETEVSTQAISGEETLQISADVDRDGSPELVDSKLNQELPCTVPDPTPTPAPIELDPICEDESDGKVMLCHISESNSQFRYTIKVDQSDVQMHLDHGDSLGSCELDDPILPPPGDGVGDIERPEPPAECGGDESITLPGVRLKRISLNPDGTQFSDTAEKPYISQNGKYAVFVKGYYNTSRVLIRNLETGEIRDVAGSKPGVMDLFINPYKSVSNDGKVIFLSDANLVGNDNNNSWDVHVYDFTTKLITNLNQDKDGNIRQDNHTAYRGSMGSDSGVMSANGEYAAFEYFVNHKRLIRAFDLDSNQVIDVHVDTVDSMLPEEYGQLNTISDSGQVVFETRSDNIVPGDTNNLTDVFVFDISTASTSRASLEANGSELGLSSKFARISHNGRFLVWAVNTGSTDWGRMMVLDRENDKRYDLSTWSIDGKPALFTPYSYFSVSNSGHVAVQSGAENIVENDTNGKDDIFVYSILDEDVERVSVSSDGNQFTQLSMSPRLSNDGRFVTWMYDYGRHLETPKVSRITHIMMRDLENRTTTNLTMPNIDAYYPYGTSYVGGISDEGHVIFYSIDGRFVEGDTNRLRDVFLAGNADLCPCDMLKTVPGACGCGSFDSDADGNGIADCVQDNQAPSSSVNNTTEGFATWRFTNTNATAINFSWSLNKLSLSDELEVSPFSSMDIIIPKGSNPNELKIFMNNERVASEVLEETCKPPEPDPTPTPDPFNYPTLEEQCVLSPDTELNWKVDNDNDFGVQARWEILGSNQFGELFVDKDSSALIKTLTIEGVNTMKLLVKRPGDQSSWEQADVLMSTKCSTAKATPTPTPLPTAQLKVIEKACTIDGSKFLVKNVGGLDVQGTWSFTGSDETGSVNLDVNQTQWITVHALQGRHTLLVNYDKILKSDEPNCGRLKYPTIEPTCTYLPERKENRRWILKNPNSVAVNVRWALKNTSHSSTISLLTGNKPNLLTTPYGDASVDSRIELYTDINSDGVEEKFAELNASDMECALKWKVNLFLRDRNGRVVKEQSSTDIKLKGVGAQFRARNRDTGEIVSHTLKFPYEAEMELGEGSWVFSFKDPSGRMKAMQRPLYPTLKVEREYQEPDIEIYFAAGAKNWVQRKQKQGKLKSISAKTGNKRTGKKKKKKKKGRR